jgi:hypothetical protein
MRRMEPDLPGRADDAHNPAPLQERRISFACRGVLVLAAWLSPLFAAFGLSAFAIPFKDPGGLWAFLVYFPFGLYAFVPFRSVRFSRSRRDDPSSFGPCFLHCCLQRSTLHPQTQAVLDILCGSADSPHTQLSRLPYDGDADSDSLGRWQKPRLHLSAERVGTGKNSVPTQPPFGGLTKGIQYPYARQAENLFAPRN